MLQCMGLFNLSSEFLHPVQEVFAFFCSLLCHGGKYAAVASMMLLLETVYSTVRQKKKGRHGSSAGPQAGALLHSQNI